MSENNRAQRRALARKSTRRAATIGTAVTGLVGSSLGLAAPAFASTESVTTCTAAALSTAIGAAGSGGTVNVNTTGNCVINLDVVYPGWSPSGVFTVNGPTASGSSLTINAFTGWNIFQAASGLTLTNMTLVGKASNNVALVYVGNNSTFDNVTIKNNDNASSSGGGIYSNYGSVTITNSTFSQNGAASGGAVWAEGHLVVEDSAFTGNETTSGGGAIWNNGQTEVRRSTFTNNSASSGSSGGAILLAGGEPTYLIQDSEFVTNTAANEGGAVYIDNFFSEGGVIEGSTFQGNTAGSGGAVSNYAAGEITNSTFVGNSATTWGGAIYAEGGQTMKNLTVWNNAAEGSEALAARGTLFGSIVANDAGVPGASVGTESGTAWPTDLGANLVTTTTWNEDSSWVGADKGTVQISASQLDLKPLKLYTHTPANSGITRTVALGPKSIARDYYTSGVIIGPSAVRPAVVLTGSWPSQDQRGVAREQGSAYDVGAYEGGSPITQVGVVRFKGFSAVLHNDDKAKIRRIAREIKASGATTVTLQGHTATVTKGKKSLLAYRLDLSRRRNRAVKLYLKAQLKARHYEVTFKSAAYGSTRPVGSNSKNSGRAANRRVVIWAE